MGCYQETEKKKKSNPNETIKSNTKISESNSRVNTKLEQIPEEKNETEMRANDEEKRDELNNIE